MIKQRKLTVRDMCLVAIFTAIIAVCAQIQIPQPSGVPFTLQTWAVALAGLVLGPKRGTLAVLVYIMLGAAGVPVFAGFSGGVGVIMRHTGGFILSFPIVALLAGFAVHKGGVFRTVLGLIAGSVVNFTAGLLWFEWIMEFGLPTSFGYAVAPFIVTDIIRVSILPILYKSIKAAMQRAGLVI
ncbi:MAG: biotin transporter BioY [Defluviitaleaceae bacterium]|nr:biotin transporter BioY [Defluviitaleaceae bacterium]